MEPLRICTIRKLKRLLTNHQAKSHRKKGGKNIRKEKKLAKEATEKVACLKFAIKMSHK